MKTQALLKKYRNLLNQLVGQGDGDIQFQVAQKVIGGIGYSWINIGELNYIKNEGLEGEERYYHDWMVGSYRVILTPELEPKAKPGVQWGNDDYKYHDRWMKGHVIATFKLYEMPHCCGIMVSCNAFVGEPFRHKGIGTLMNNLRQDIGRQLGYSVILCTDIETNTYQRQLLKTNGWKDIYSFLNRRTSNQVYIAVLGL
jgi:hypothetical protein